MVNTGLLDEVMRLDESDRLEVRDAIEASVADDYLTMELAALLATRVADDDAADHNSYITLEDDEREVRARCLGS
ncbi:MAG: hypothetical protein LBI33_06580 [Propionibacteriaceae bacterium]|jgi:hypothetical protein|nr:hypothetical protein [Propionibacteriaceae bacterium]